MHIYVNSGTVYAYLIIYIQLCVQDPSKINVSFSKALSILQSKRKSLFQRVLN